MALFRAAGSIQPGKNRLWGMLNQKPSPVKVLANVPESAENDIPCRGTAVQSITAQGRLLDASSVCRL